MILQERRTRNKNLAVAWNDYKKVYDTVPHSWIVACLGMVEVSEKSKHFLPKSVKKINVQN